MKLDYNSPIPLHAQLKQKMTDRINDGYYSNQLPSERSFMDEFENQPKHSARSDFIIGNRRPPHKKTRCRYVYLPKKPIVFDNLKIGHRVH